MFQATTNPLETKTFTIPRQQVVSNDVMPVLALLHALTATPDLIRENFESIELVFAGYGDNQAELWHIPEVRKYVRTLHAQFPHWQHVCSKDGPGLLVILMCLMPEPPVTQDEGSSHFREAVDNSQLQTLVKELQAAAAQLVKDGFSQKQQRFMETQFNRFMQQVLQ